MCFLVSASATASAKQSPADETAHESECQETAEKGLQFWSLLC